MRSALQHFETVNQKISSKSVGWQMHHLKIIEKILAA
jgi:hypothetical protein